MEKDLATLIVERDILKHKHELEQLREENVRLMQRIEDKIDNAKAEITDNAITKTMNILDKTRSWLQYGSALFAVFITAAGFVGYNSINKELTAYYKDTVRHWLRFEDNDSGGGRVLDELRTNALLDSLTLKYERDKAQSGIASITLNNSEKKRLMSLVLDPKTDERQYRDALRLIVWSRGVFGLMLEDDIGKEITGILGNSEFSNSKKLDVLEYMSKDRSLLPWSLSILNDRSNRYDEGIIMYSFRNIALFDKELARQFALENINSIRGDQNRIELAQYLIKIGDDGAYIDDLINFLKNKKQDDYYRDRYKEIIIARVEKSFSENDDDVESSADYVSNIIDEGLEISLGNVFDGMSKYYFSLNGFSVVISNPEAIMGNNKFINAIIKTKPLTIERLSKMTLFFQSLDRGQLITTLMMKPSSDTMITFEDNSMITGGDVLDYIWLRVEQRAGKPTLISTWRGKNGRINESVASKIISGERSCYYIDFNKQQLLRYTWKRGINELEYL